MRVADRRARPGGLSLTRDLTYLEQRMVDERTAQDAEEAAVTTTEGTDGADDSSSGGRVTSSATGGGLASVSVSGRSLRATRARVPSTGGEEEVEGGSVPALQQPRSRPSTGTGTGGGGAKRAKTTSSPQLTQKQQEEEGEVEEELALPAVSSSPLKPRHHRVKAQPRKAGRSPSHYQQQPQQQQQSMTPGGGGLQSHRQRLASAGGARGRGYAAAGDDGEGEEEEEEDEEQAAGFAPFYRTLGSAESGGGGEGSEPYADFEGGEYFAAATAGGGGNAAYMTGSSISPSSSFSYRRTGGKPLYAKQQRASRWAMEPAATLEDEASEAGSPAGVGRGGGGGGRQQAMRQRSSYYYDDQEAYAYSAGGRAAGHITTGPASAKGFRPAPSSSAYDRSSAEGSSGQYHRGSFHVSPIDSGSGGGSGGGGREYQQHVFPRPTAASVAQRRLAGDGGGGGASHRVPRLRLPLTTGSPPSPFAGTSASSTAYGQSRMSPSSSAYHSQHPQQYRFARSSPTAEETAAYPGYRYDRYDMRRHQQQQEGRYASNCEEDEEDEEEDEEEADEEGYGRRASDRGGGGPMLLSPHLLSYGFGGGRGGRKRGRYAFEEDEEEEEVADEEDEEETYRKRPRQRPAVITGAMSPVHRSSSSSSFPPIPWSLDEDAALKDAVLTSLAEHRGADDATLPAEDTSSARARSWPPSLWTKVHEQFETLAAAAALTRARGAPLSHEHSQQSGASTAAVAPRIWERTAHELRGRYLHIA